MQCGAHGVLTVLRSSRARVCALAQAALAALACFFGLSVARLTQLLATCGLDVDGGAKDDVTAILLILNARMSETSIVGDEQYLGSHYRQSEDLFALGASILAHHGIVVPADVAHTAEALVAYTDAHVARCTTVFVVGAAQSGLKSVFDRKLFDATGKRLIMTTPGMLEKFGAASAAGTTCYMALAESSRGVRLHLCAALPASSSFTVALSLFVSRVVCCTRPALTMSCLLRVRAPAGGPEPEGIPAGAG
jgi:hypothetical protein